MKNHKNAYNNLIFKLKTCVDTYGLKEEFENGDD